MKEKILLDTDIGSDIDDAICLSYLLSNPDSELVGITTVTGEPEKRAMIASYLCEKAKKDIPVFPGMSEPLIGQQKQKQALQFEYLEKISYHKAYEKDWFNFLRNTIRRYKGEIVLLTIGPLTNIGILFKIDPELPSFIKAMYIMGGNFFDNEKKTEWNISCDPFAAHTVFNSGIKNVFICGLDVTKKVKMNKQEVFERFTKSPILKEVLNFAEVWFRKSDTITFHDPLAACTIFNKDICRFKKGKVFVEQLGQTGFIEDEKSNVNVAYDVDCELFFSHFFSVFF